MRAIAAIVNSPVGSFLLINTLMNFPTWKFALLLAPKHWERPLRSLILTYQWGQGYQPNGFFMQELFQQNSDSPSHIFVILCQTEEMFEEYVKY